MDQAGGGTGPWITVDESLLTQHTITKLVERLPYFFRYSAKNVHGYSEPSNVFYSLMATAPDQIQPSVTRTVNDGINVVISWDASPNDRGSAVFAYRILIHSKNAVGIEQEQYCKGSEQTIVDSLSCSVPISVLTTDPYFLEEGDIIVAQVEALNSIDYS